MTAPPEAPSALPPEGGDAGGPAEPDPRRPLEGLVLRTSLGAAVVAAGAVFLPSAASGLVDILWLTIALVGLGLGIVRLHRTGSGWLLAWVGWLLLSCFWSPASAAAMASHGWHGAVLLAIPLLAGSVGARQAVLALQVFVGASLLLGLAWLWMALWPFSPHELASTLLLYDGNKSISNGVLMALASALAGHFALTAARARRTGPCAVWAGAAFFLAAMVLWRCPARSAHLCLGLLSLALVWFWQRRWWARLAMLAAVFVLAAGMALGWGGLGARSLAGQLDTSNQQRWMLYSSTAAMALERPISGHGLGSWETLWPERAPALELKKFNTAHSAPLELLAEGGIVSLGLLAAAFLAWAGAARHAGVCAAGGPLALVLLAWGVEAAFNAALRDAAFAAPMIVLLSLALAATAAAQSSEDST